MLRMTIGKRIGLGFAIVLLLLLVVGTIAMFALTRNSEGFTSYRSLAKNTNLAGRTQADMLQARFEFRDFLLDSDEAGLRNFETRWANAKSLLAEAQKEITDPENAKKVDEIESEMGEYRKGFEKVVHLQRDTAKLMLLMGDKGTQMEQFLAEIMLASKNFGDFETATQAGLTLRDLLLCRLNAQKFYYNQDIKSAEQVNFQLGNLQDFLDSMDKKADKIESHSRIASLKQLRAEYQGAFEKLVQLRTERQKTMADTMDRLGPSIGELLEQVKLSLLKKQDQLGPVLQASNERSSALILIIGAGALFLGILLSFLITRAITRPIKGIVEGLTESADQVASAARQVSGASLQLAEGASEQAASIEETSSSLEEMSSMTKQNANHSGEANLMMIETVQIVGKANSSMEQLTGSMQEISRASEETSKIIKTIDEIAFQTNLLALNAAVEAARAGEAGAGFAVVADEVRNLAMRAADAAKNTSSLIESTVSKIKVGSQLVGGTSSDFAQVALSSEKMSDLVGEIKAASAEQAQGIEQINKAVSEMDKIVQQNAANAEESSSASEEMSSQAEQLKEFVARLVVLVGGGGRKESLKKPAGVKDNTPSGKKSPAGAMRIKQAKTAEEPEEHKGRVNGNGRHRPSEVIPLDAKELADF